MAGEANCCNSFWLFYSRSDVNDFYFLPNPGIKKDIVNHGSENSTQRESVDLDTVCSMSLKRIICWNIEVKRANRYLWKWFVTFVPTDKVLLMKFLRAMTHMRFARGKILRVACVERYREIYKGQRDMLVGKNMQKNFKCSPKNLKHIFLTLA